MHFKRHGFTWFDQIFQDIHFSLRMLRKSPGFTAIVVISLALAIGVNLFAFWFINEMLLRPLFPLRPKEVVNVYTRDTAADPMTGGWRGSSFSEFSLLRESDEVFADVSAFQPTTVEVGAKNNAEMQRKNGWVVSDNYFSMLGVRPAMGRFFLPEESRPNAKIPVVVVSRSMWESIGGGNDFSERTVTINGEVCTIVGVVPKGFRSHINMFGPDIWLPMGMASGHSGEDLADPATYTLTIIARLQRGLSLEAAKARLPVLAERLTTIAVDAAVGSRTLEIQSLSRLLVSTTGIRYLTTSAPSYGERHDLIYALQMGMAGVVLLVACLNLANMFLARNITRLQELKVRMALGASRRRIIRILSVEGLILSLMGGAAGLLVSCFWIKSEIVPGLSTTPDIRMVLATLLFCVIATLISAVAPAIHTIREIARGNLSLQHSTRTTTDRWGRLFSGRHCLLMAQLALTLALLFSAGLFFRDAYSAAQLDLGFAPEGDLVAEIDYSRVERDEASVWISIAAFEEELRALPDVRKVALSSALPLASNGWGLRDLVMTAGAIEKRVRKTFGISAAVSSGYFDIMGIELLRGRDFTDQECLQAEGAPVVIIDQGMADTLFPGEDPLGKYIQRPQFPGLDKTAYQAMEVIGVVSPHWDIVLEESPPLRIFLPLAKESPTQKIFVHIRGQTSDTTASASFREIVRSRLRSHDLDISLVSLKLYPDILAENYDLAALREQAVEIGKYGSIALLLAVIGVYGVWAFVIARRMREIGIRMALGASRRRIYALLIKQGAVQIAIGLGAGVMLSLAAGKLLASKILHVSPRDPVALGIASLILAIAAFLATWIPTRRAAKVDPMEVLRWE